MTKNPRAFRWPFSGGLVTAAFAITLLSSVGWVGAAGGEPTLSAPIAPRAVTIDPERLKLDPEFVPGETEPQGLGSELSAF